MKPLLIGLDNPHSRDSHTALLPVPKNGAGDRLLQLIREADRDFSISQYMQAFDRVNLYPTGPAKNGRGATWADHLAASWAMETIVRCHYDRVVLLGDRVQRAFGRMVALREEALSYTTFTAPDGSPIAFYRMPHPSGRNRFYNQPENRQLAAERLLLMTAGATEENDR